MKKAEDIIFYKIESDTDGCETFYRYEEVIKAIKLAQEDSIRRTAKECAENAQVESVFVSTGDYSGHNKHIVNKQSILSVADKLIKEI
jgi:hypothetical protein